jgi:hypothetical protein
MEQARERTHWRPSFLSALELFGQAGARLPFGVPDPVLCGGSAVELYTGGLWVAADLEVVTSDARLLTAELFAVGFRWSERPRQAERGLWHPELQIGININDDSGVPSVAEQLNRLVVILDLEPSRQIDVASLKVVGIEDLIARQVGCWLMDGTPSGELAGRLEALVGLGRQGVGGPLAAGYLQRRLARETDGEVVVEMLRSEEGRVQSRAPRTTSLTHMHTRISTWRDQCGLTSDRSFLSRLSRSDEVLTCLARNRNGEASSGEWSRLPSAEILLFDTAVSPPPGW